MKNDACQGKFLLFLSNEIISFFLDINECDEYKSTLRCPRNSECRNLEGSYECLCHTGYEKTVGTGNTCNGMLDQSALESHIILRYK